MARVLIVHDDPLLQEITSLALEIRGHVVSGAQGAEDALRLTRGEPFDLVVLDSSVADFQLRTLCRTVGADGARGQILVTAGSVAASGWTPDATVTPAVMLLDKMAPPELHDSIIRTVEALPTSNDLAGPGSKT